MRSINYIIFLLAAAFIISSCEKKDVPMGLPEYDHHYYAAYLPVNNTLVSVNRTQTALLKFPVQFYSSFTRDYNATMYYAIVTTGITNPAVLGQDFNIVNKDGAVIPPVDGKYSIVFPQAKYAKDTIYVKLLNSTVAGTRRMEVQIQENKTQQFYVDIFSTAFRRPVEIK
ncbi:MAG: hypothetical protein WCF67_15455 [Chitinophagaceae bacterium]